MSFLTRAASGGVVGGASSLSTAGSIAYVASAGVLGQDPTFARSNPGRYTLYIAETLDTNTDALLPEAAIHRPATMPDLGAFSKEVREFLEAGIKTVEKGGKLDHGDSTTKN